MHRNEAVVSLVEVEELLLLLDEVQGAVEVIAPAVVLAHELAADAARLLLRVVVPDQLVAAVAADVVESTDLVVRAAHDDDGRARHGELLRDVATLPRQLLHPPNVQPGSLEDGLALERVELG